MGTTPSTNKLVMNVTIKWYRMQVSPADTRGAEWHVEMATGLEVSLDEWPGRRVPSSRSPNVLLLQAREPWRKWSTCKMARSLRSSPYDWWRLGWSLAMEQVSLAAGVRPVLSPGRVLQGESH